MSASGLRQIRDTATRREREARAAAVLAVDAVFHPWCGRPHDTCVCQSNELRSGAVPAEPREKRRGRAA